MTTTTFTFRASEEEAALIRQTAEARRISASEVIRRALRTLAPKKRGRDQMTPGCVILSTPPLDQRAIDAVIYDHGLPNRQ